MFLARLLKPSWVRVDDTAAQLSPNFQSEQIKALQVVILKVVKLSPAKAVLFYFQLPCRCDPFRQPYIQAQYCIQITSKNILQYTQKPVFPFFDVSAHFNHQDQKDRNCDLTPCWQQNLQAGTKQTKKQFLYVNVKIMVEVASLSCSFLALLGPQAQHFCSESVCCTSCIENDSEPNFSRVLRILSVFQGYNQSLFAPCIFNSTELVLVYANAPRVPNSTGQTSENPQ